MSKAYRIFLDSSSAVDLIRIKAHRPVGFYLGVKWKNDR
jgi:uncharacterized protein (DUF362 family)